MIALVLLGAYNALASSVGASLKRSDLTSNMLVEGQWHLFSYIFLLAGAYTLRERGHVRVDVVYDHAPERIRRGIDRVGTVLFLIPFCLVMIWTSLPMVAASWRIREGSPDPDGLARYPLKTMIPLGFALLLIQGLLELRRTFSSSRPDHPTPAGEAP